MQSGKIAGAIRLLGATITEGIPLRILAPQPIPLPKLQALLLSIRFHM
jgi:hypothetical protein